VAVIAGLWTALQHPTLFILLLVCFILLMIWLLPKLWRGIKTVFRGILRLFGRKEPPLAPSPTPGPKPEDTRLLQDSAEGEKKL
jgi:CBS domain containing-hemolysin-like protein